ncbi:DUF2971 domain-containing protein [Chryseobacterium paludis]|uniref:DUF2971 domain-containing protein n=1 Tax=Chryseobacterium paludis TaxID=2956784 RepID=UPI0021BF3E3E|nr:DUF2971 domain-containing protein [Chryseobacterium paludis]
MNLPLDRKSFTLYNNDLAVEVHEPLPDKLYKYFSINKNSINNFITSKVHFSNPFKLNDIMEGSSQLWNLESFIDEYTLETGNDWQYMFDYISKNIPEDFFAHRGVLCLTDSFDNNLFWPHYTSELGFCVEFKQEMFFDSIVCDNKLLYPIDYKPLERIEFKKFIVRILNGSKMTVEALLPMIYSISVKDVIWNYEREWRLMIKKNDLGKVSHPLRIIDEKQNTTEIDNLQNRNIFFDKDSIQKVIVSTLFFSNSRFSKIEVINNFSKKYYFKSDSLYLFLFFLEIAKNYNDRLFQIDRDVKNNIIVSKLNYKHEVIDITEKYVTLKSHLV